MSVSTYTPDVLDLHNDLTRPAPALELSEAAQDLLFRRAATASSFADEPVSDEQLRAVFELIKYGPTAMNSQPLRVALVRTPEARADLVEQMSEGNRAKTEAAPLVAVLAADHDFHDELPRVFPVAPGARDAFADDDRRAHAAGFNAALPRAFGTHSDPRTWARVAPPVLSRALGDRAAGALLMLAMPVDSICN